MNKAPIFTPRRARTAVPGRRQLTSEERCEFGGEDLPPYHEADDAGQWCTDRRLGLRHGHPVGRAGAGPRSFFTIT